MEEKSNVTSTEIVPIFTDEELRSEKPFEYLYSLKDDEFLQLNVQAQIMEQAKKAGIGVRAFQQLYKAYKKNIEKSQTEIIQSGYTEFDGQPLELQTGRWETCEKGVYTHDKFGFEICICPHPIMPVKRLVNIDTGVVKIELAYKRGNKWYTIIVDRKTLASKSEIVNLANSNIAVTSETASGLISYLSDMESMNYDKLPEVRSISRLGWLDNDDGEQREFIPYTENVEFDGEANFRNIYMSIAEKGDFGTWLDIVRRVRKFGKYARIVLAASFASVILKDCNLLPFFVHLWGGTETGKTVSLMLAASVWGNPGLGEYVQSFNSTAVGQEMLAGLFNNLPMIMDELQIIKDRASFDEMIYKLTEGIGRTRGSKTGGLQKTQTWRNCILTTGEYPIVNSSSGAGAVNRIIEVDCKNVEFFENPKYVVDTIKENYGFAGKYWVDYLKKPENLEKVKATQKKYYAELERLESTAKQAASASAILTADEMITELFFKDENCLTVEDIAPLLISRHRASHAERALQYIYDCVEINASKFMRNSFGEYSGEVWGTIEDEYIYIIKSKLDSLLDDGGYNCRAFISWAVERDLIYPTSPTVLTRTKRITNNVCRCIALKKPDENDIMTVPKKTEKPKQPKTVEDFDMAGDEYDGLPFVGEGEYKIKDNKAESGTFTIFDDDDDIEVLDDDIFGGDDL